VALDECVTTGTAINAPFSGLPPCNWCEDAGVAVQGKYAGISRYTICQELYSCMLQTGCGENPLSAYCLCGTEAPTACANDTAPPGPCADLEMGAFEVSSQVSGGLSSAIINYTNLGAGPYFCAGVLNKLWQAGKSNDCYPPVDAGAGSE
jgi:hypothetical protein